MRKKKKNLTTVIFIALLCGALAGLALNLWIPAGYIRDTVIIDGIFYVIGQGFIRLMQMLVVPLVFCSLVCGSMAIGDTKRLGRVGVKTIGFYLLTTAVAISAAIFLAGLINPGLGLELEKIQGTETAAAEKTNFVDTVLHIIPTNPLEALAKGEMLPIILFALILGVILAHRGEKADMVSSFFSQFNDIIMDMTMGVMTLAPAGVFCLIARTFAGLGLDAFVPLLKYMLAVILALAVQGLVVYQVLLKLFTGLSPIRFLHKFAPVMAFAFSTATSNATIPLSIDTLYKKMGVSKKISSFTIPLGATINMDGTAIMQGVAVVFAAQAFQIHLSAADFLTVIATATLASVGTAGVPGVGLITLSMVFQSVGLPVEAIGLIMGNDRILDMTRTAVNITGDAVCTTIVAKQDDAVDVDVYNRKDAGDPMPDRRRREGR